MAFEVTAKITCNRCNKSDNFSASGKPPAGWARMEMHPIEGPRVAPASHIAELCPGCAKQATELNKLTSAPQLNPPKVPNVDA